MEYPSPDIAEAKREMEYHLKNHPDHAKVQVHLDSASEDSQDKREVVKSVAEWGIRAAIIGLLIKLGLMN